METEQAVQRRAACFTCRD